MVDIGLGGFHDRESVRTERKLIRFPNVTDGRLADAIALLTAPGTERELRSEAQFRRFYRSASLSWPVPRQRRSRLSVLVGVASVASVFATATGLSAASVLPSSASHAVNSVLGPLNADGGSPTTPPPSATQPLGSGGAGTAPNGASTSLVGGSATAAGTNAAGTTSACRHGNGSCTVHHAHSVKPGRATVGTTGGANKAVNSNGGSAQTAASGQTTGGSTSSPTGPPTASTGSTGSGSTSGTGSNRGGNLGGQGGSTSGTGSKRGGNSGSGSGSGKSGRSGGRHAGRHGSTNGSGSGSTAGSGVGKRAGSRGHRHSGSSTVTTPPPSTLINSAPNDAGA